jgi:S-adenosylmethionine:tRNA ribosyltransferase-isomerase
LAERDSSRLLVLRRETGAVEDRVFRDLPELLSPGDLVVVNRSRVIPARLLGRRAAGGRVEILLLRPLADRWEALVRPSRRLRVGERVEVGDGFDVVIEDRAPGGRRLVRLLARAGDVTAALEQYGHTPLPPYIRRADRPGDRERYQTVYAREKGSVAAPTAGLHFTPALLQRLKARGIDVAEIVLHVGPGTFLPVRVEQVEDHRVEPEPYTIPEETSAAMARARRVVAVGTTTVRTLESSAARFGGVRAGDGSADVVIVPGFEFRVVKALLTNFHLPRSSPLLLVSAFAGRQKVLAAYHRAIESGYRFYSYGDAMLVV